MTDDAPQIRIAIDRARDEAIARAFRRLAKLIAVSGEGQATAVSTFAADLKAIRTARDLARKAVE